MQKTILITGSTDGIGFATAKMLLSLGHNVILHARTQAKLDSAKEILTKETERKDLDGYVCDLSSLANVEEFTNAVAKDYNKLDVLINNAGVFNVPETRTPDGLDVRFAVNAIAPYLLTKKLIPLLDSSSRVINLSSAAQAPVDIEALKGKRKLPDSEAYAQSKLALTMWSRTMALELKKDGPAIIAVNPKSFLGTQMVKTAYGRDGADVNIGAEILTRAALSDEFKEASGKYFDNDIGQFASPHPDALNPQKSEEVVNTIEVILAKIVK